ncbi:unnamed protein product, partial [Rotaria magnacalcarata]
MNKVFIPLVIFFCCSLVFARPPECELTFDTGICRGMFPAVYFDSSSSQCKEFIYGGCGVPNIVIMPEEPIPLYRIKDVWAHNVEEEFRSIRKLILKYPFVAM